MYSNSSELNGKKVIQCFQQVYYRENGAAISTEKLESAFTYDKTRTYQILGTQFENLGEDYEKLETAMETLVEDTGTRIPQVGSYLSAMSGQATSGFKVFIEAISESASDISTGLQAVGNQAINTGKILTTLMPFLVIGAIIYFGKNYLDKANASL